MPTPVAVPSKAWVFGHSLAGIVGSYPIGGKDYCLLWVLCVGRYTSVRRSPVQRSSNQRGASECDHESSIMRSPWPTGGCWAMAKKKKQGLPTSCPTIGLCGPHHICKLYIYYQHYTKNFRVQAYHSLWFLHALTAKKLHTKGCNSLLMEVWKTLLQTL